MQDPGEFVERSELLTRIFGYWPSFHDAEVLEVRLWRGDINTDVSLYEFPVLTVRMHLWELTKETERDGRLASRHHTLATIRFHDVMEDFELSGFNHQNAIFCLALEKVQRESGPSPVVEVGFQSSFGMGASFSCRRVEVTEAILCDENGRVGESSMSRLTSESLVERFRHWYEYERDCNAKCLVMLRSVPEAARSSPQFARAVGKFAHLVAARHMWLFRLGVANDKPESWFPSTTLEQLPAMVADVERRWTSYLSGLTDADLHKEFEATSDTGKRFRWPIVDLLTQVFGHAWYHRGQIAMLVKDLGGEPVDTDYIFWDRPTVVTT